MVNNVEKPEYKWYFVFPFTRGRKDYLKDRERYDNQFLTDIQKVRREQNTAINSMSTFMIFLVTSLWTLLPPLIDLPNWLGWTKMGMEGFGSNNWGNQIMLTLIPTLGGTCLHHGSKIIPGKKSKIAINLMIKFIPVLLLTITYYLIKKERQIIKLKKQIKTEQDST